MVVIDKFRYVEEKILDQELYMWIKEDDSTDVRAIL